MRYKCGDWVNFYPSVIIDQVFCGRIIDVIVHTNQYIVVYEGSRYCVHEQFIVDGKSDADIKGWSIVDNIKIKRMMDVNKRLTNQLEGEIDYINQLEENYNKMREESLVIHGALLKAHKIIAALSENLKTHGVNKNILR
jgi:hypothetical protein